MPSPLSPLPAHALVHKATKAAGLARSISHIARTVTARYPFTVSRILIHVWKIVYLHRNGQNAAHRPNLGPQKYFFQQNLIMFHFKYLPSMILFVSKCFPALNYNEVNFLSFDTLNHRISVNHCFESLSYFSKRRLAWFSRHLLLTCRQ